MRRLLAASDAEVLRDRLAVLLDLPVGSRVEPTDELDLTPPSQGVDALVEFLDTSMTGLATWDFPHFWEAIDGDRVFLRWSNRLPGSRPDGSPIDNMGMSYLEYAGDGLWSYQEDLYNPREAQQVIEGWIAAGGQLAT